MRRGRGGERDAAGVVACVGELVAVEPRLVREKRSGTEVGFLQAQGHGLRGVGDEVEGGGVGAADGGVFGGGVFHKFSVTVHQSYCRIWQNHP